MVANNMDELISAASVSHTMSWGVPASRMVLKQIIAAFRTAFLDLHCTVKDDIYERDKLAAYLTMRGTHKGPFLGNPPTGRTIVAKGIIFACTENDRIVEDCILVDQMGMLQQIGIVPPPRGSL